MDFTVLAWAVIRAGAAALLLILRAPGPLPPGWRRIGLAAAAVPVLAALSRGGVDGFGLAWGPGLAAAGGGRRPC